MASFIPVEQALLERARLLIRLRWMAIVGATLTLAFTKFVLRLPLYTLPLTICLIWVIFYNSWLSYLERPSVTSLSRPERLYRLISFLFNAQIALDWITLAAILHFSGGLENPFFLYFVFHAILAGMLLSRRASYIHATLAILLVSFMGIGEQAGWIAHVKLGSFLGSEMHENRLYVTGVLFSFATTMYLAVFLTTTIASVLRRRETELAVLQESLHQANEALLEKDRLRSEYVLRVSHGISSPLAAAYSMIDLVIQTMSADLQAKPKEFLIRSRARLDGLLRFARELFDISRIRASRTLAKEPFAVPAVVQEAIEKVLTTEDKRVDVSIDLPPYLPLAYGDRDHVEMALVELLRNAAQYALLGVMISVRVREVDGWIQMSVQDTGVGIPESELPHVYDEFYRGTAARELHPGGWGLGLALVKLVVERHGGTIDVTTEMGKGTRFTMRLPRYEGSRERQGAAASVAGPAVESEIVLAGR